MRMGWLVLALLLGCGGGCTPREPAGVPPSAQSALQLALDGDPAGARAAALEVLAVRPIDVAAYYLVAALALDAGEVSIADRYAQSALALEPASPQVRVLGSLIRRRVERSGEPWLEAYLAVLQEESELNVRHIRVLGDPQITPPPPPPEAGAGIEEADALPLRLWRASAEPDRLAALLDDEALANELPLSLAMLDLLLKEDLRVGGPGAQRPQVRRLLQRLARDPAAPHAVRVFALLVQSDEGFSEETLERLGDVRGGPDFTSLTAAAFHRFDQAFTLAKLDERRLGYALDLSRGVLSETLIGRLCTAAQATREGPGEVRRRTAEVLDAIGSTLAEGRSLAERRQASIVLQHAAALIDDEALQARARALAEEQRRLFDGLVRLGYAPPPITGLRRELRLARATDEVGLLERLIATGS